MHFDREAAAVAAHVGDLDDIGVTTVERLPDRHQVIARQIRVEHVDVLADDLLARPAVGAHAGAIEIHHRPVLGDDADRIGHGVEKIAVALAFGFRAGQRGKQGLAGAGEQGAGSFVDRGIGHRAGDGLQGGFGLRRDGDGRRAGGIVRGRRAGDVHVAAIALPALLPVSRPSRAASQRPVSPSRSRSTPVAMPMPCSM